MPTQKTLEYSIAGALVVQEAVKQTGQPITLGGRASVVDRATLESLYSTLDHQGEMTLAWRGTDHQVVWATDPIETETLVPQLADPESDDLYQVTIKLVKVD